MSLKAQLEAIIYAAETPITVDQMVQLVKDSAALADTTELRSEVLRALTEDVQQAGEQTCPPWRSVRVARRLLYPARLVQLRSARSSGDRAQPCGG